MRDPWGCWTAVTCNARPLATGGGALGPLGAFLQVTRKRLRDLSATWGAEDPRQGPELGDHSLCPTRLQPPPQGPAERPALGGESCPLAEGALHTAGPEVPSCAVTLSVPTTAPGESPVTLSGGQTSQLPQGRQDLNPRPRPPPKGACPARQRPGPGAGTATQLLGDRPSRPHCCHHRATHRCPGARDRLG